ncbi:MAG: hypothetical protein IJL44_02240 [Bacteroidales bacterium]|nr:hypothetical protein [Bacteroidales bacterium]
MKKFWKRIKDNPLSAVLQLLIILLLLTVIAISFNEDTLPYYFRWIFAGLAVLLGIIQFLRIRCPMLLIDRIFANSPGKQLTAAIFVFILTLNIALCIFPRGGIRNAFADFVSAIRLTYTPSDTYHFADNKNRSFPNYTIIRESSRPVARGEYLKHWILYILGLIVFNGLLIATINRSMTTRADQYRKGKNTYKRLKNHYLIIGYGASCVPIIRNIAKRASTDNRSFFLILSNQDTSNIRLNIQTQLQDLEERIIVYSGDMNSRSHMKRLNIGKAKEVYVLGENDEPSRDSKNLECAKSIKALRIHENPYAASEVLHVNIQFDKPDSYSTIKRITLPNDFYKDENGNDITYLRPFNFYENWARMLWGNHQLEEYLPLDRGMLAEADEQGNMTLTDKHIHLVIAGFNTMGTALLLEALRVCHYPNYDTKTERNKTVITILDPKMNDILPRFKSQYPYLDQITDIQIDYKANRIEDPEIRSYLNELAQQTDVLLTVAICFTDSDESLSTALSLPDALYYQVVDNQIQNNTTTQILLRQEIKTGLVQLLNDENGKYSNVKVFGTLGQGVDDKMLDDNMAVIISAYYHFKYDLNTEKDFFELMEEDPEATLAEARKNWIELNEDKRFANRYQTEIYNTYQTYRRLLEQQPELLYQTEHLRWCAERSITGYRDLHQYNLKNDKYQIHKLIIPYSDLSDKEKGKDKDVLEIMDRVTALASTLTERIV